MKTFFYKKLIPLAMITSLTATSMATVAEAAQVQTDAPETAVETADVPAVPADLAASIANNAPVVMGDEETEDPGDDNTDLADGDEDDKKDEGNEGDTPAPPAATDDLKFADDAEIKAEFDVLDTALNVEEFSIEVAKSAKVKSVKPTAVSFLGSDDKAVDYITVTGVTFATDKVTIKGTVKANAPDDATNLKVKIGNFTSVNTVKLSKTKGWFDSKFDNGAFSYKGTNELLDIPQALDSKSINKFIALSDGAVNTSVKKIVVNNGATIETGAFKGWTNLSMIELADNVSITINSNAFEGCTQTIAIVAQDAGKVTNNSGQDNVIVYTRGNVPADISAKAGDTFDASWSAKTIRNENGIIELKPVTDETKSGKNAVVATGEQIDAADPSTVKWTIKNASFAKVNKDGTYATNANGIVYGAATVTGSSTKIGKTTAAGKFNKIVTVTASIPVLNDKGKTVYAEAVNATLYVNPVNVTSLTATGKTAGTTKFEVPTAEASGNCKLEMDEGASFKPTISVNKEASNKALAYAVDGDCVTVVNGTVKAVAAGKATITVTPVEAEGTVAPIVIDVTVKAKTTKAQLNTNSITVVPGAEAQEVTLSAVPASNKTVKAKATFNKDLFDIQINGSDASNEVEVDGAATVTVALKKGKKAEDVKATDKKVDLTIDGKTVKLTVNAATAPQNLKKINEKSKVKKGDDTVKINIPVGGVQTLGVSANPATADNALNWAVAGDKESLGFDDVETLSDADAGLTVNGDVVKANATGTYFVQAQSRGLTENNKPLESQVYEINVYDPGSSIVWDEEIDSKTGEDAVVDYVIKGDYLMTKTNAREGSDKTVPGGQDIVIAVPDLTGIAEDNDAEKVNWTVSDPSKVKLIVNDKNDTMTINVGVKGTYTITGTTEFTKQKYTFKVNAVENWTTDNAVDDNITVGVEGAEYDDEAKAYTVKKGDKIQVFADLAGNAVAGKVTFTPSDRTVANVNAKGQITALKASDTPAEITVKFDNAAKTSTGGSKEVKIKVKVNPAEVTSATPATKIATNAGINTSVAVSGAPDASAKWVYENADGTTTDLKLAVKDGKVFKEGSEAKGRSAKVIFTTPGVYTVYAVDAKGIKLTQPAEIEVFDVVVKNASVVEPYTVALKDLANKKIGISPDDPILSEGQLRLAIKATGVDANGKTVMASGNEITWASSNVNIATAVNDTSKEGAFDPYSHVVITLNKNNYEGAVTLTGTIKNSGKKVKVTLYVKASTKETKPETKPDESENTDA